MTSPSPAPSTDAPTRMHAPRLGNAMLWISGAEVAAGIVSAVTSVVSARVLAPGDFGLMASVGIVIAVLEALSYTGFEQALIQSEKSHEEVTKLLDSAWTWQALRGLVLGALFATTGSLLARFYDEPRIAPLVWAMASVFVLRGVSSVGPIFFARSLDFRRQFVVKVVQIVLGAAVYVPAVLWFRNVWALCLSQIGGAIVALVVSYAAHPYRPRFSLERRDLVRLVGFGKWVSMASALVFFGTQGDDLFVSRYLGLAALGVYQMAYAASNLPATHISHVVSRASLPAYARMQSDRARVRTMFLRVVTGTFALSATVSVAIALLVPSYVRFVVTEKWAAIVPLVRILAFAGLLRAVMAAGGALFQALGRPQLDFQMQVPRSLILILGIWPAAAYGGLPGVAFLALASIASCVPTFLIGIRELLGIGPLLLLRQLVPGVLVAAPLGLALQLVNVFCVGASAIVTLAALVLAVGVWAVGAWWSARAFGIDLVAFVKGLRAGEPPKEAPVEPGSDSEAA